MTTITRRREFIGWLGASALVGATPSLLVGAELDQPPRRRRSYNSEWDLTWTDRITGRHRAVFDAPELAEGDPILRAVVWGSQYQEVFGVEPRATSRVLVLRHLGIHFAMNDSYWARFEMGKATGFVDSSGRGLTVNPVLRARRDTPAEMRDVTLEGFQASGGLVLACHLALVHYVVPHYVAAGLPREAALQAALDDVVPGITMQPSGIFALSVAQDEGCRYVPAS